LVAVREASSNESISADSGSKADLAARSELQRLVGSLPVSRVRHFKNRREQLKTLKDAVSRGPSLTQVCGRGGAGKTALVTKLLLELRGEDADHAAVDAIVYASLHEARARSVDSIVGLIHPALDPNRSEALRARWTESIPLQDKLEFLFQFAFRDDRLLIVLDNLEDVLDETNQIRSEYADLQAFIEICLDYETSARLLVASRRPLSLPYELVGRLADRYIEVSLDEGLPERDAVALLRELDGDGRLGFQRAEEETLREVVGRCHGMPRLLESLVGTLRQKRTWDITKLLTDRAALESIVEFPARELYHSLSDEERAVMQALAVYEIPIPAAAVKHLLPALEIDDLLENLARNYAVYYDAGKFSLHPLDQAFAYAQIPEKGTEHSRKQLHLKAAVFYSITGNPKVKPKTLEDVQPQLREFFHLVRAGWHETACKVLNEIDHRYLLMWGHAALAVNLRKSLQDWLDDRELEARNLEGLGDAYCDLGQLLKSVKYLQQAH
jgi:hypothetical protein